MACFPHPTPVYRTDSRPMKHSRLYRTHQAECGPDLAWLALPVTDKNSTVHKSRLQRHILSKKNETQWKSKTN